MNIKLIKSMLDFYENITKEQLLMLHQINILNTWLFILPNWFSELQAKYLAHKVNKHYNRIQEEIGRLKYIINLNK